MMSVGFILLTVLFCMVSTNDCQSPDKCTCLETMILCQNIFGEPRVRVTAPGKVTRFYLSNSYINSLDFLDEFENLVLLSLYTDVRINCTLVYRKMETTLNIRFDVSNCPGRISFFFPVCVCLSVCLSLFKLTDFVTCRTPMLVTDLFSDTKKYN